MNFFERQRQVKRMSGRLVLLFVVAVVAIVATIDLIAVLLFGGFDQPVSSLIGVVLTTSLIVVAVIGLSSLFRSISLRSGGGPAVARSVGATPVPADPTDPDLRRLRNVVEEIAIASGTPVPQLYVMENEAGINAFAAGWSPADAAVAVTRGALQRLNRDELQGVIAHEFSHVVNGDMRLNIKLMGLLFGILVLAIIGRVLLALRGGKNNPLPLIGLVVLVAGFAGLFIGRIIKAAVSRQREYLADTSAVQFTRQTGGLVGALKKIGGLPMGSNLASGKAEDVSHMLFGTGKGFSGLFATHPPLLNRIQALDPTFNAAQLDQLKQHWMVNPPPSGLQEDMAMGAAPALGTLPPPQAAVPAAPAAVAATVGAPTDTTYQRASSLLGQIPEQVLAHARNPHTVVPLVFGLLFSEHQEVRANQHAAIAARHGRAVADAAWQEGGVLLTLHPLLRLPLAEVAFPALRERPEPEQDAVMASVQALIQADGRLTVSEYCLSRLLQEELYEARNRNPSWGKRRFSLGDSRGAAATLLALLAAAGNPHPQAAEQAFHAGIGRLYPQQPLPYAPPPQVTALEPVWPALDGLGPSDKEQLIQAIVTVIGHDGQTTVTELELLRTVCAMLHCPMPPLAEQMPGPAGETPRPRGAAPVYPPHRG
jgi:Zn-dependent protease with chaperone function